MHLCVPGYLREGRGLCPLQGGGNWGTWLQAGGAAGVRSGISSGGAVPLAHHVASAYSGSSPWIGFLDWFLSGEWASLPICQGRWEREHAFLKPPSLPVFTSLQTEAAWIKARMVSSWCPCRLISLALLGSLWLWVLGGCGETRPALRESGWGDTTSAHGVSLGSLSQGLKL